MGAGGSISSETITKSNELYAFRVTKRYYDRYYYLKQEEGLFEDFNEELLYKQLINVFREALTEKELDIPFLSLKSPAHLMYKFENELNSDEQMEYCNSFKEAVVLEEKKLAKRMQGDAKRNDYSSSFGGTAADTKNEAEAAKLMRGEDDDDDGDQHDNIYLRTPKLNNIIDEIMIKYVGPWFKYMGASGCYVYIHSLSKEVASMRPNMYEEMENTTSTTSVNGNNIGDKNNETVEEIKDESNGLKSCNSDNVLSIVEEIQSSNTTVLLLDTSDEQILKTFYSYKANLFDASVLTIPFAKGGIKRNDLMEKMRIELVNCMKSGKTFVLYLGGVTNEHADFKNKLCKKDVFPVNVFQQSGKALMKPSSNPKYKLIFRDEDLEHDQAIIRDGFNFIVLSSLSPYDFEDKLEGSLPLGYMEPCYLIT